jgi:tetratricopeptide (TPR) repeat protein
MAQAVKAQRAGNTNEALLDYQLALGADPTYFDAQYNLALLMFQMNELKRSLAGWEMALALQPDSINARYNFALALKQGDYAHEAAQELQRILEAKPNEVRAHLTLGNLYAQQLNEPHKARPHYLRVVELEPQNPQAPAIRYWLAANP